MESQEKVPSLSLIIPVYNQGRLLAGTLDWLRQEFSEAQLEVIVIDDGSTDENMKTPLKSVDNLIVFEKNRGKGAAVRAGVLAAKNDVVIYTDADLAYKPSSIRLIYEAVARGVDAAVGSRHLRGWSPRAIYSRVMRRIIKVFLLQQERDTQCGAKAFRKDVAQAVFKQVQENRFAFDLEVFCLLDLLGAEVVEIAMEPEPSTHTTVRFRDGLIFLRDIFKIRRRLKLGEYSPRFSESPGSSQVPNKTL